jgi:hypothetical protein
VPVEYLPILLAERFGGGPMLYRDMPADERAELLAVLAEEARITAQLEDLGADDDIVFVDDDDWDEDEG